MIYSTKVADIISKALSPVVIAMITTIIFVIGSPIGTGDLNPVLSIVIGLFFLSVFPTALIVYFYKKGVVDLDVSDKKKRAPLYIVIIGGYVVASTIFYVTDCKIMFVLSMAYVCVTSVVTLANFFTKVSAHSAGATGPLLSLIYVFGVVAIPLFVLFVPLVIWARIKLNAHTSPQLITGALIAMTVTFLVYSSLQF